MIQTGRKHCGKGEISRYEQFLLFPQCFQKACFPEVSKSVIVQEWVKRGQKGFDKQILFGATILKIFPLSKCLITSTLTRNSNLDFNSCESEIQTTDQETKKREKIKNKSYGQKMIGKN